MWSRFKRSLMKNICGQKGKKSSHWKFAWQTQYIEFFFIIIWLKYFIMNGHCLDYD